MKTLLTFSLCLLAIIGNAANPSTKSFRATGGLAVSSNDITGLITYDGSGISSPTGGVSASMASNIAGYYATNSIGRPATPLSSVQVNGAGVMSGSSGLLYTNEYLLVSSNITLGGSLTNLNTNAFVVLLAKSIQRRNSSHIVGYGSVDFQYPNGSAGGGVLDADTANSRFSFIGGGGGNSITNADNSFLGSGIDNVIETGASFVGSGNDNHILNPAIVGTRLYNFIGGGSNNELDLGLYSVIVGGQQNHIGDGFQTFSVDGGFIGGGAQNEVDFNYGAILGGLGNSVGAYNAQIVGNSIINAVSNSVMLGYGPSNVLTVAPAGTTNSRDFYVLGPTNLTKVKLGTQAEPTPTGRDLNAYGGFVEVTRGDGSQWARLQHYQYGIALRANARLFEVMLDDTGLEIPTFAVTSSGNTNLQHLMGSRIQVRDKYDIAGFDLDASYAATNGRLSLITSGTDLPRCTLIIGNTFTDGGLQLWAAGAARATVSSNGAFGIGITNPGARLHFVSGDGAWDGLSDPTSFWISGTDVNKRLVLDYDTVGNYGVIQAGEVGNDFRPVVLCQSGGNVGISTTTPANKLDVEGAVAIGAAYSGTSTAPTDGLIVVGKVGIGTSAPGEALHIAGGNLFMGGTNRIMFSNGTAFVMSPTNDAIYLFKTNGDPATLLFSDGSTGGAGFQSGGGAVLNAVTSYSNVVNLATMAMRAIKLTNGAVNGYVLTSDANGLAAWAASAGGGSTQMVTATFGTITVTNTIVASNLNVTTINANNINVTNLGAGFGQGHSNAIPFIKGTGNGFTYYDTGSSLTNPGFGFNPQTVNGPQGGYGGLMVFANESLGLVTIGHPNPGGDFSTLATALTISNRYNGAGDFKNDMIKFDAVLVNGSTLQADSTMTRWRVWQAPSGGGASTSSNDVAELSIQGQLTLAHGTMYPSNSMSATMPTAAQLGPGGHWLGNSNASLVSVYSLNGTTTAMKVLAP